ncbi:hypothetical protein [Methylopila sp. Yamaguchi]|uniref:hypothetical protein n=1 Tax=Methylopila sp. Yamaguchi TaxID=1437817 RepID=UPI000CB49411|nr:hypothetical protein [Methylopila sp. Yamaguchi]GBD48541.1 hypothetical protein METY_1754 [Methylopila sp. Yamaguchi]
MATEEQRLLVLVEARVDGLEKQLKKANDTARRNFREVGDHAGSARKRIEGDTRAAAENANKALATIGAKGIDFGKGFAAGALAGGLAAVTAAAKTAISSVAELKREAERAGVGTAAFQELSFAARQSGVTVDALTDGLKEMNLRADEFILTGKGSGAEAFQRLGYNAEDLKRKLKDPAALFVEIIGRLKQLDEAARIRVADEVFGGTGGEQFVRFVDQGAAGLTRLREEARATGVVIKDDVVDKAVELDRKFQKLVDIVSGNFKSGVVEIAGYIEDWASGVGSFISMLEGGLASIGNSVVFRKLNDWFGGDPAAAGITIIPQGEGADVGRAVGSRFATAIGALDKLGKSAREASGKLDDITLPPQGMPVAGASQASPFASGDAVSQFVRRVIAAESGGKADAKNPNSSATGVGQFVKDTWLRLFREAYPTEARTMGESAILELRKDADISKKLIETYAAENATALRNAGLAVTEANLHLAHFLGAGGAVKALKADPRASARAVLGDAAANANPTIIGGGRSVGDVLAYADRRASSTRVAAGDRTDAEKESERQAAAVKRVTEALGLEADQLGKTAQQQALLQALQQAGVSLNSAEGQAIQTKVQQLYALKTAQEKVEQSAEAEKRARETLADMGANATTGIISDLRNGVSAAEAFSNALGRIADQLIEMALKQIFQNAFAAPTGGAAGGGGVGFLGFLGTVLGFADGGEIKGPGTGTSDSIVARVSNGEFVVRERMVQKHRPLIEAINADKLPAFATGGLVGGAGAAGVMPLPAPVAPQPISGASQAVTQVVNISTPITVNGGGGSPEQNDELARRISKEFEGNVRGIVASELRTQMRPGNMLNVSRR